ncbi:hypothetical protein D9613_006388 [Agrocybe pediades]|uniref:Uncharacterized protein n=1 Tax=Agrocybe pediades TaxID=84607 RepID=A0A8H4QWM3_9AGAR|nr:hypothetical protein D9613_006388 [Agrocybe pediades]
MGPTHQPDDRARPRRDQLRIAMPLHGWNCSRASSAIHAARQHWHQVAQLIVVNEGAVSKGTDTNIGIVRVFGWWLKKSKAATGDRDRFKFKPSGRSFQAVSHRLLAHEQLRAPVESIRLVKNMTINDDDRRPVPGS